MAGSHRVARFRTAACARSPRRTLTDAALAATGGAGSGERAIAALIAEGRTMAEANRPGRDAEAHRARPRLQAANAAHSRKRSTERRTRGPTGSPY